MTATRQLAESLIARPSVTPDDAGCLDLIGERLAALGFRLESLPFGPVSNLWARRGDTAPLFVFAGHTDVVPPGPMDAWTTPPFKPTVADGRLRGRGSADMKTSLAAMVTATEAFLAAQSAPRGSIAFLLTSDEEGPATEGTAKVVETLQARGETIDWCLVGEPSSQNAFGDVIKNGRRGSLSGELTVRGIQGHIAYPDSVRNPIHALAPALTALTETRWDAGSRYFPPTSFQISNIHGGTGATNVVPGEVTVSFNFRYSTETSAEDLQARVTHQLDAHGLDYTLNWKHSGTPFLTEPGALVDALQASIAAVTGRSARLLTTGGTSDARFIAPTGAQVAEFGPVNATIHQVDEAVGLEEIDALAAVYRGVLERLLGA
jgi:succinyl-diaminopimelate desuccinylase